MAILIAILNYITDFIPKSMQIIIILLVVICTVLIFFVTAPIIETGRHQPPRTVDCNRPFAFMLVYQSKLALFGGRVTLPST